MLDAAESLGRATMPRAQLLCVAPSKGPDVIQHPARWLGFVALVCGATGARAQSTVQIGESGEHDFGGYVYDYFSGQPSSMSDDGRYVAYVFENQTSGFPAIYESYLRVYDRFTSSYSGAGSGSALNHYFESWSPQISGDGGSLAYAEPEGFSFIVQTYVGVEPISVNAQGMLGNQPSYPESISTSGRFVTFSSFATNLVPGGGQGIYLRDRMLGVTEIISSGPNDVAGNGQSDRSSVSADGRFVAFQSTSSNLVANDPNGHKDVFVRDRQLGTTLCISVDLAHAPGNGDSGEPSISADGRFVAFSSAASNLVVNDTNGVRDIFVRDLQADVTRRVNLGANNAQLNSNSYDTAISADGRFVAFDSLPSILGGAGIFVRDRTWNVTERVASSLADRIHISGSGRFVVYGTGYPVGTVWLHDRGTNLSHPYCNGDGSAAACPCNNSSAIGSNSGCLNAQGIGAQLVMSGAASLVADTAVLHGSRMPDSVALYFQGTLMTAGGLGVPFGDGLRCVGGSLVRFSPKQNVAGASAYPGLGDASISAQGLVTTSGSRYYQVRYRNSAPFCTSDTFNLSNGLEILWTP
jgi:hypothetical protein